MMPSTVILSIPTTLLDISALGAAAVGISKGFEWVEDALSPDGKKAISEWLRNRSEGSHVSDWSSAFLHRIDQVFGVRPLSFGFFVRSSIASVIAVAIVVAIYSLAHRIPIQAVEDSLPFLGLCLIPNLPFNYLGLVSSRAIVKEMVKNPTPGRVVRLLVLDTVLKIIAATCVIYLCSVFLYWAAEKSPRPWLEALGTLRGFYGQLSFPFRSGGGVQYGLFFYASFFTSIWVWFYVLGGLIIKGLTRTGRLWRLIVPFLNLDVAPLKAIGRVVAATLVALYAVGLGILRIIGLEKM
jgi:hypothetical protein